MTTDTAPKPQRRWFRFGLRSMLVLVTLFGCWLGYQVNWIRQRHEMLATSRAIVSVHDHPATRLPIAAPRFLWLLGESGYYSLYVPIIDVMAGPTPDEALEIKRIQELFPEAHVGFPLPGSY